MSYGAQVIANVCCYIFFFHVEFIIFYISLRYMVFSTKIHNYNSKTIPRLLSNMPKYTSLNYVVIILLISVESKLKFNSKHSRTLSTV